MHQRQFCFKDELNTDVVFGRKKLHSSRSTSSFCPLRLLLWTTFNGEWFWIGEESQKICFRWVLVGSRSARRVENVENSPKSDLSGRFWSLKIAKSLCSRKIGAARKQHSSWTITWLVEKVPRIVMRYAPEAIFLQRWAGHICSFWMENSS